MNTLINHPDTIVTDMVDGYLEIYPQYFEKVTNGTKTLHGIIRKKIPKNKVSIVIGGGSGNEPWCMGYVGKGLADGAAIGQIFTAPPARTILNVTQALPTENGVLYLCANHSGDVLNFELASELAEIEGIATQCIFVADDIASDLIDEKPDRRGVAGVALAVKIAGAVAEAGCNLEEVVRITQKANRNLFTFGVNTTSGYMPGRKEPIFCIPDGQVEYGMGFSGETGVLRTSLTTADEVAETLMNNLFQVAQLTSRDEIAVMINGYAYTSWMELCLIGKQVSKILKKLDIKVYDIFIDKLFGLQGTGGCSITILKLDQELKQYYDAPAFSPFYKR